MALGSFNSEIKEEMIRLERVASVLGILDLIFIIFKNERKIQQFDIGILYFHTQVKNNPLREILMNWRLNFHFFYCVSQINFHFIIVLVKF